MRNNMAVEAVVIETPWYHLPSVPGVGRVSTRIVSCQQNRYMCDPTSRNETRGYSTIFIFLQHSIDFSLKWCKNDQNRSTGFEDNVKLLIPKSVILRNRQIKFSSYNPYWRVACCKQILITLINFWCVYFSDLEKTGETDSFEKPNRYMAPPLGKWLYPKSALLVLSSWKY